MRRGITIALAGAAALACQRQAAPPAAPLPAPAPRPVATATVPPPAASASAPSPATSASSSPAASCERGPPPGGDVDQGASSGMAALVYELPNAKALAAACDRAAKHYHTDEFDCITRPGSHDAWAVLARNGYWQVIYIPKAGAAIAGPKSPYSEGGDPVIAGNDLPGPATALAVFDYDGDGRSELVTVYLSDTDVSGGTESHVEVWTARHGRIAAYGKLPSAGDIVGAIDEDNDGRPDLVIDPYKVTIGGQQGRFAGRQGWTILAHSLPGGGWSTSDRVARKWARTLCSRPPELDMSADAECMTGAVHCALLWGIPPARITHTIDATCNQLPNELQDNCDIWKEMTKVAPPLRLGSGK